MKKFIKNLHSECAIKLNACIDSYPSDFNKDPYKDYLSAQERKAIRQMLLQEQNSLCIYCEKPITIEDCHTEHIRPQSTANKHNLQDYLSCLIGYENLAVSCDKNKSPFSTCGHRRGEVNLKLFKQFINPVKEDPRDFFRFNLKGEIKPRDNLSNNEVKRANYTISNLDLNSSKVDEEYAKNLLPQSRLNAKDAIFKVLPNLIDKYGKEKAIELMKNALACNGFVSFVSWYYTHIFD